MKKIGVILEDLGMSQLAYSVIFNINKACEHNSEDDYVIFFNNMVAPVIPPNCAVMNSSEIWSFDGHLIGTSVSTALMALKSINPAKKYFYVWVMFNNWVFVLLVGVCLIVSCLLDAYICVW